MVRGREMVMVAGHFVMDFGADKDKIEAGIFDPVALHGTKVSRVARTVDICTDVYSAEGHIDRRFAAGTSTTIQAPKVHPIYQRSHPQASRDLETREQLTPVSDSPKKVANNELYIYPGIDQVTPVRYKALDIWLEGYNTDEREYLVNGFKQGFAIDFIAERVNNGLECRNQSSVDDRPQVLRQYIQKEIEASRLAGPFKDPPFGTFMCSPVGVRPKSTPGKFRVIQNLSAPYDGSSVNHGIPLDCRTVKYPSVQNAIDFIIEIIEGPCKKGASRVAFMAKTDIKGAFRLVPIRQQDLHLLGFRFEGMYYHDLVLPMGAASSCRIFQRLANAINWIAVEKLHIRRTITYVDDTFIVEGTEEMCRQKLELFKRMCADIGLVIAEEKTEGPATKLCFLGIELDAVEKCARLPLEKLKKCSQLIEDLLRNSVTTLGQLLTVIGTLSFACSVIEPGRCFLRRLINLTVNKRAHRCKITLNHWAREDLRLWLKFLAEHNGVSFFRDKRFVSNSTLTLFTDAATSAGYGAVFGSRWFCGSWGSATASCPIVWMELYAVVAALALWANRIANKSVLFMCDNEAVVAIINKKSTKDEAMMRLVRVLVLACLRCNILFKAKHIPGVRNILADHLSRFRIPQFQQQAAKMRWYVNHLPDSLPVHLGPDELFSGESVLN